MLIALPGWSLGSLIFSAKRSKGINCHSESSDFATEDELLQMYSDITSCHGLRKSFAKNIPHAMCSSTTSAARGVWRVHIAPIHTVGFGDELFSLGRNG